MKQYPIIQFETLATTRLQLRLLTPALRAHIFNNCDDEAIKYWLGLSSDEALQVERAKHLGGMTSYNRSFLLFQLIERESGRLIGNCGLHNWFDEHHRSEIGYVMNDDNDKQKGYMTEALEAILAYGFNVLKLHRIEAMIGTANIASQKLVTHFHFKKEVLLKEHFYRNGKYEDSMVFALLKSEYDASNQTAP